MYNLFNINKNVVEFVNNIENELTKDFFYIDKIYERNQLKVLKSFIDLKISESHFIESTGYGYNDLGRDVIEELYSKIFNTESSLVRQQIVSGTHAISLALFAITKTGDKILSINGLPYDTIRATLGLNNEDYSLKANDIEFDFVELKNKSEFDYDCIKSKLNNVSLIMIQRSRGYSDRNPLSINQISDVIKLIKSCNNNINVLVDNCYGEFVDVIEPSDVGADIICGSLIKNPGGGLARSGGYICGKKCLIDKCACRLTAPGIGKEVGINFNQNRNILHGMYLAPQIVANSLKISKLFTKTYNRLSFKTVPSCDEKLNDIVTAIYLNSEKNLQLFCEAIQETSPIDSFVKPIANDMPGYNHKVIMSAGNFISGSSIELSCDAPLISPYIVYLQGGLTYYQGKLALMNSIEKLGLLK